MLTPNNFLVRSAMKGSVRLSAASVGLETEAVTLTDVDAGVTELHAMRDLWFKIYGDLQRAVSEYRSAILPQHLDWPGEKQAWEKLAPMLRCPF